MAINVEAFKKALVNAVANSVRQQAAKKKIVPKKKVVQPQRKVVIGPQAQPKTIIGAPTKTIVPLEKPTRAEIGQSFQETVKKDPIIGQSIEVFGRGLGNAASLIKPDIKKTREGQIKNEQEFLNKIAINAREAKLKGDEKTYETNINALKKFNQSNTYEDLVKAMPTKQQTVGAAVNLAAVALMGYNPAIPSYESGNLLMRPATKALGATTKGVKALEMAKKTAGKPLIENLLTKAAPKIATVTKEGIIGGAVFGASKAQEPGATPEEIKSEAKKGAVVGALGTGIPMVVGAGATAIAKKTSPIIRKTSTRLIEGLETAATGAKSTTNKSAIDSALANIGKQKTIKQSLAGGAIKVINQFRGLRQNWIDKYAPIERAEKRAWIKGGEKPLKGNEKVYRDIRLMKPLSDAKTEKEARELLEPIYKIHGPRVVDKARAYMGTLDAIDRARLGNTVAGMKKGEKPFDHMQKVLVPRLNKMQKEIASNPGDMIRVNNIRKQVGNFLNKKLDEGLRNGIYTKETIRNLRGTHPNYFPHSVIVEDTERITKGLSNSLNVGSTDLKRANGSLKNIDDPFEAIITQNQARNFLFEKNKGIKNLIQLQETKNVIPGAKRISETTKLADGFEKISFFRKGIKETWQVPLDVAKSIRAVDVPIKGTWFKIASFPATVLKKASTTYNLSFTLTNKFRDKQTAALTTKPFIDGIAARYGISKSLVPTRSVLNKMYKEGGSFGSSIFEEGKGKDIAKKILAKYEHSGKATVLDGLNPLHTIGKINDAFEASTRKGVFKSALRAGLSPKDAIFASREGTIDFAKMGIKMQSLNQIVPFLNARVQGFVNIPKALARNPEAFARMQLYTAVYPSVVLHGHNRQYASYKNVSDYIKNKYWVIMTGEEEGVDPYTGKTDMVPQFITIPKGEGQMPVANPVQYFLDRADGNDPRKVDEMMLDTLGSMSPIEFQTFNRGNVLSTVLSQLGPIARTPVGLATNVDPYTGSQIIPDIKKGEEKWIQYKTNTSNISKDIGKKFNISPAQLDFAITGQGGAFQDILNTADIGYTKAREKLTGEKLPGTQSSLTDTTWGKLSKIPLLRRFIREAPKSGSPEEVKKQQEKEQENRKITTKETEKKEVAQQIYLTVMKMEAEGKTLEEKKAYLKDQKTKGVLTPEIKEKIIEVHKNNRNAGVLTTNDSSELRAVIIYNDMQRMKINGSSKEEKLKYLKELKDNKILTDDVRKELLIYATKKKKNISEKPTLKPY